MASWNNAPPLLQIAATQQGGSRGALLYGITNDYGRLNCVQETPGGAWSNWGGTAPPPAKALQVAAAQQNNGCCQVWVTDSHQNLWSATQSEPGSNWWTPFSNWGKSWNNAPHLDGLAAVQQGGSRGAQLWGITLKDMLVTTYQETPGGNWSPWSTTSFMNAPPAVAVAGAQQNNGNVGLWMLDQKQQLWFTSQTSPGGNWQNWSGPNWNKAPQLQAIAASQQGGSRGAQLWGIDQNNQICTTFQETPGGSWSPWVGSGWSGTGNGPPAIQLAAAQQNNGCVQLWAIDPDLNLHSITQKSPGGDWNGWQP
jgi:hypothetical protein